MDTLRALTLSLWLLVGLGIAFGAKADPVNTRQTAKAVRAFPYKALQNILREANDFLGDLNVAKKTNQASNSKLEELRTALNQKTNKSSVAVFLPQGWDKKTIIDAINKALNNNKNLQDLSDKFNTFMEEIEDLRGIKPTKNRIKEPSELVPPNAVFPTSLDKDNSTVMGKLIGFVKTGRRLGSLQLSDLNPCSKVGCEKWSKGLDNLRSFLSKGPSRLSELFQNFATLRKISEEPNPVRVDDNKVKVVNKPKLIDPKSKKDSTKEPVDYFDSYYNHEDSSSNKKSKTTHKSSSTTPKSIKKTSSTTKKSRASGDYSDYYYNQGIPSVLTNRSKIGGE